MYYLVQQIFIEQLLFQVQKIYLGPYGAYMINLKKKKRKSEVYCKLDGDGDMCYKEKSSS